ncbi:3-deoxy-D-manno-octulosonic acid transferase [Limnovirga soli]|uniref:3-deoxy-D-manno-octulosonic acid transferase n=1 Tax=Limnovirga soli TaxID=2656915 RepID=A0A8J8FAC2_9BACT|nr:glycosyltransferase N-terminal domain-containing protein [Limnovirga soli]NNV54405.1 3-deoxy-D-manno-octulosonic acid transferase [Limnovirga soli]
MGKFFYILFIRLYPVAAQLAALFNKKAALWVKGRKNIFNHIAATLKGNNKPTIWVHCASLGEFEQGRPVIEAIKQQYPAYTIVLTFFSPSGYEAEKNYHQADYIFYLPIDSKANAKRFLDLVKPSLVIFIKYEFWFYYLQAVKQRNTPLLLVSGIFRSSQPFFKSYGAFHRQMLGFFTHLFVQHSSSVQLLNTIGINNQVSVAGDTRFDRVLSIAQHYFQFPIIDEFCKNKTVIVAGSTWLEDEEELCHYANAHQDYRFIIAPHNIESIRLKECTALFKNAVLYSAIVKSDAIPNNINTIIIDNIGMLKMLYSTATLCYIGGGFGGDGVHNVLEAAVYYKPVIFGPVYDKFIEARALIEKGGAFTVIDAIELEQTFNELLQDKNAYTAAANSAGNFVKEQAGATNRVIQFIQEKRLLTN